MNIVVITGASSGMGREFAMQLDRGLHSVDEFWLIARRGSRLKEIASGMQHTVKILPLDLTNEADMTVLTESLAEEKPVVRMLINCAGYGMMGDFTAVPIKEQTGEVDLNCRALLEVTYGCLPYMRAKSRIIQLASSAAFLPQPGFSVYAATKSFVLSFSKALRAELKERQIYVTAVCPGPVKTEFFEVAEHYATVYDGRGRSGGQGCAARQQQKPSDVRLQSADSGVLGDDTAAAAGSGHLSGTENARERNRSH